MTEVGEPTQYGYAERLMRTIKEEEVDLSESRDYHDVYQHIGQFIEDVYMHKRVHSALGYLTPAEFEQQWLTLSVNERATLCCPVLWGQYKHEGVTLFPQGGSFALLPRVLGDARTEGRRETHGTSGTS
jgi:hypothetical protein